MGAAPVSRARRTSTAVAWGVEGKVGQPDGDDSALASVRVLSDVGDGLGWIGEGEGAWQLYQGSLVPVAAKNRDQCVVGPGPW